jgi:hypothetical protein
MRQRRVYKPAASTKANVFSEGHDIHELKYSFGEQLREELDALPSQVLLNQTVDDIVNGLIEKYTLKVPKLDRDNIVEVSRCETQMPVPQFTQNRAFFGPGPHYVPATAITIGVPFTGDRNLLRFPSSMFTGHIPAELGESSILMTHVAERPDPTTIKQDFDNRMQRIETELGFISGAVQEWNSQLTGKIRPKVEQRHAAVRRNHSFDLGYAKAAPPAVSVPNRAEKQKPLERYDVFLSHASEDKQTIAKPLYDALIAAGVTVWYDAAVLRMGDHLRRKIQEGLLKCRFGIVVISPAFLSKNWTQQELDGLAELEVSRGEKTILPIWHNIDHSTLVGRAPMLAGRMAGKSSDGIDALVQMILEVVND